MIHMIVLKGSTLFMSMGMFVKLCTVDTFCNTGHLNIYLFIHRNILGMTYVLRVTKELLITQNNKLNTITHLDRKYLQNDYCA